MAYVQEQLLKMHDPLGKRREFLSPKTGVRPGDLVKVTYNDRTDITGKVIGVKRGHLNLSSNILIRTKLQGVGSEVRIPVYNPNIRDMQIVHKPTKYMSGNQQYYSRGARFDVGDAEAFVKRQHSKPERDAAKKAKKAAEKKLEAAREAKREAKRLSRERLAAEHALEVEK